MFLLSRSHLSPLTQSASTAPNIWNHGNPPNSPHQSLKLPRSTALLIGSFNGRASASITKTCNAESTVHVFVHDNKQNCPERLWFVLYDDARPCQADLCMKSAGESLALENRGFPNFKIPQKVAHCRSSLQLLVENYTNLLRRLVISITF